MKKYHAGTLGLILVLALMFMLQVSPAQAQSIRGAGVSPESLPKELEGLDIKDRFIATNLKRVGVIHALNGHVVVIHRATKAAYFGSEGDTVYENDSLNSLAESRCRIKFINDDVVTMGPDTQFAVEEFQDQRKQRKKSSLFSMFKGKAMFYAMRLFRYKESRFRLKTPTVTVGVRGTKFGADIIWEEDNKRTEAGIRVADSGSEVGTYLAAVQPGGTARVSIFAFKASVDVTDEKGEVQRLDPGEIMDPDGRTRPMTQQEGEAFQETTEVKKEGEPAAEKEGEEVEGDEAVNAGLPSSGEALGNAAEGAAEQINTQTGDAIEKGEALQSLPIIGYFTNFLTQLTGGGPFIKDIFISKARQVVPGDNVRGDALLNDADESEADFERASISGDDFGGSDYLKQAVIVGEDTGDLGTAHPITSWVIDTNDYMEWGRFKMTHSFSVGGESYVVDNYGHYIGGSNTLDSRMDALASQLGSVTYSGTAEGRFWESGGPGVQMTGMAGSFSADVNFNASTQQVTNFNMSVSGGGKAAAISGGKGSFASSQFSLDRTIGTWTLTPGGAVGEELREAHGAFFGPNAEHIGGVWGMKINSSTGAQGIFVGGR
ncbi:FecR domain-containing protein [Thermodesulfobacteriota bacterium]